MCASGALHAICIRVHCQGARLQAWCRWSELYPPRPRLCPFSASSRGCSLGRADDLMNVQFCCVLHLVNMQLVPRHHGISLVPKP